MTHDQRAYIVALELAGKHLAFKLAECYRAVGAAPADCQAIRQWIATLATRPPEPRP